MKKCEFGRHFTLFYLILLLQAFFCFKTCVAESFEVSEGVPSGFLPIRANGFGSWIPLPRKQQDRFGHLKRFEAEFSLPYERVPNRELKNGQRFLLWMERQKPVPHGKSHLANGSKRMVHAGGMNRVSGSDHSGGMANRAGTGQKHGIQTAGLGEGISMPFRRSSNHEEGFPKNAPGAPPGDGIHAENHGEGLGSSYLAKLRRFTTLQPLPGMAMGLSILGHGPEMWAQYQFQPNACMAFNLQHEKHDAKARLSLDVDL